MRGSTAAAVGPGRESVDGRGSTAGRTSLAGSSWGADRASQAIDGDGSDDEVEPTWVAQTVTKIQAFLEHLGGNKNKEVERTEAEELGDIIKTFRGIQEEEVDVSELPWVDRPIFDIAMSVVIVLNTIVIGLETDLQDDDEKRHGVWITLECVFVIIFWMEIIVKVREHGIWWITTECTSLLCTLVAVLALVDLVILFPMREEGIIEFQGVLRMISLLRIVGLLRLLRIIREIKALEELRLVLEGLKGVLPTISWVVFLVAVFLYICSIITTKAIGQNEAVYEDYRKVSGGWDHEELFGTIARSMYTLLQILTLDKWCSSVARHVITNQPYMVVFFFVYLLIATYGLLNVVVAVIVERTLNVSENNENRVKLRELRLKKQEVEDLTQIFQMSDADVSNVVDVTEFTKAVANPLVTARLAQHEINVEDALKLFEGVDNKKRELKLEEFVKSCTKIKGVASSKDLLEVQAQADTLGQKMEDLSRSIDTSERMITALDEMSLRIKRRFASAVEGSRRKIAHAKGGREPVVPPWKPRPGMQENLDLSIGNRPLLPHFPNLLS